MLKAQKSTIVPDISKFQTLGVPELLEVCDALMEGTDLQIQVELLFALYLAWPKAIELNHPIFEEKMHKAFFKLLLGLQLIQAPVQRLLQLKAHSGEPLIKIIAYLAPAPHLVAICTLYQIANERIVGNPYELKLENFLNRSPLYEMITSHAHELLAFYCQRKELMRDYSSQLVLPSNWSPFVVAARCGNIEAYRLLLTLQSADQYCELMREMPERRTAPNPDIISVLRVTKNTSILKCALDPFILDMKNTLQYSIADQIINGLIINAQNDELKVFLDQAKRVDLDETQEILRRPIFCYNLYRYANVQVIREVMHIVGLETLPLPQSSRVPFIGNRLYAALRNNQNQINMADIAKIKNDVQAWILMYSVIVRVSSKTIAVDDVEKLKQALVALFEWRLGVYHAAKEDAIDLVTKKTAWLERCKSFRTISQENVNIFVQAFQDICNHGEYFYPRFQAFILYLESREFSSDYLLADELMDKMRPLDNLQKFEVEKNRAAGSKISLI